MSKEETEITTTTTTTTTIPKIAGLPLHRNWVLWHDNPRLFPPAENRPWLESLERCGSFHTAEAFWEIYNNVKPPSTLPHNSNYHIFQEGIAPMWEDGKNVEGGKFVLTMQKRDSKKGKCDEWWLFTILNMIGETMDEEGDEICGAVVSIRKSQDKIALWLKSCDTDVCTRVAARWKKALELSHRSILKFQAHKGASESGNSYKNPHLFEV